MVYVGIMGHGTVGSGVVEVLNKNVKAISKRAGDEIQIKRILDLRDFDELPYSDLFTKDSEDILNDPDIKIVVEVMGGIEPAYTFTKKALMAGKHVVTSNKELVAQHGPELLKIAHDKNVNYFFEASVGGGIPIIRPLKQCLAGNDISKINGILNGTTNYILSEMKHKGKDFEEALADAQDKGYAERDPSADIEGFDAQRKIAILGTIAFDEQILFSDIATEGISNITKEDILFANEMGYVIKLVASAERTDNGIWARVCPTLIEESNPLADVEDVFNAIMLYGDAIGDVMFYGRGAGKLPTASAVVGDIIDAAKHLDGMKKDVLHRQESVKLMETDNIKSRYFVRIKCDSMEEVIRTAREIFPESKIISLDNELLKDEFGLITQVDKEGNLNNGIDKLKKVPGLGKIMNVIRVQE